MTQRQYSYSIVMILILMIIVLAVPDFPDSVGEGFLYAMFLVIIPLLIGRYSRKDKKWLPRYLNNLAFILIWIFILIKVLIPIGADKIQLWNDVRESTIIRYVEQKPNEVFKPLDKESSSFQNLNKEQKSGVEFLFLNNCFFAATNFPDNKDIFIVRMRRAGKDVRYCIKSSDFNKVETLNSSNKNRNAIQEGKAYSRGFILSFYILLSIIVSLIYYFLYRSPLWVKGLILSSFMISLIFSQDLREYRKFSWMATSEYKMSPYQAFVLYFLAFWFIKWTIGLIVGFVGFVLLDKYNIQYNWQRLSQKITIVLYLFFILYAVNRSFGWYEIF